MLGKRSKKKNIYPNRLVEKWWWIPWDPNPKKIIEKTNQNPRISNPFLSYNLGTTKKNRISMNKLTGWRLNHPIWKILVKIYKNVWNHQPDWVSDMILAKSSFSSVFALPRPGGKTNPETQQIFWRDQKPAVWRLCERDERVKKLEKKWGEKGKLCKFHLWIEPIEWHHSFGLTVTFHACPIWLMRTQMCWHLVEIVWSFSMSWLLFRDRLSPRDLVESYISICKNRGSCTHIGVVSHMHSVHIVI